MKKKILAAILALVMLLSLAGCATEQTPTKGTKPTAGATESPDAIPTVACDHADADADDSCDGCGLPVVVELDLFAINDLHGKYEDTDSQPGVDELSTYLTEQSENTILLSSGDMWQGSSESNLTRGALVTEWMNELGFVSMTLGNHEFDWGEDYIESNAELAEFPFLAINIYDKTTNKRVEYCAPSVVVERGGITIGIIGAIGNCYSSIAADFTEDIYFKTGSELNQLVMDEATRLREGGVDIIVYSVHYGDSDAALTDGYVDLVFEGHSHSSYAKKDSNGVYHVQGGGENQGVGYARIQYNMITDTLLSVEAEVVSNEVYDDAEPHAVVDTLLEKYADEIALASKVLGDNSVLRDSDALCDLVSQLYYKAGQERWGDQYDIVVSGAYLKTRSPYNLGVGTVIYSQVQSLLPFDNELVLCSIQGRDLQRLFFSGTKYHPYYEAYGEQVKENLDPNATYYVITDTYSSTYKANKMTEIERYGAGTYARDLLADYISEGHFAGSVELTTIPALLDLCAALEPGETSQGAYRVRGKIVSIQNSKYGNLTIEDENGNQLYIYGVYDSTGMNRYEYLEQPPQVGDTVVLSGAIQHYVSPAGQTVYEMVKACLVEAE